MNIHYSLFILLIPLIYQITPCSGSAKLMLRFNSFENPGSLKEDGECCDGERRNGNCTGRCDYSIRVCLSRNATGDPCELQRFDVGSIDVVTSSFTFPSTFVSGFANPVPISLDRWQGDVIVSVTIIDEDTQREERVDYYNLTYSRVTPVTNRPIVNGDFMPYLLAGRRVISPTSLNLDVTVQCDRFFYGDDCLVNCVENDDCNGHYTCNPVTGDKICNSGWGGDNCSLSESPDHGCFSSQVCNNNAECIRYGNGASEYYCCCAPGFTGVNCEIDIDECQNNPCENGGSCTQDIPNTYQCLCPVRFKGDNCELQRNCNDSPCLNEGICRAVVDSFFCICNQNFTGDVCETSLLTTTTPAPTTPACPANFYGPGCSVFCEPTDDCSGHYLCDVVSGNKICRPTWGGANCTIRTFVDASCSCQNGGQCFDSQCCCPEGFTGALCETRLYCNVPRCQNDGQCFEEGDGYRCACRSGFTGENCEIVVPNCPPNFYGPTCSVFCEAQDNCFGGQWNCNSLTGQRECRFGWTGSACTDRDVSSRHRTPCPDSECRNGGVCTNSTCCCPVGYTGSLCHIEILECASNPCRNNARCEDLIGDYLCICEPGYSGKNCENFLGLQGITTTEQPDPCLTFICLNTGSCISNGNRASCQCRDGYSGDQCEIETPTPGSNSCLENFYGPDCNIFCQEQDTCQGGHYYCNPVTGQRICKNGWVGQICNTRVLQQDADPECPSVGCRNQGQCFNGTCCCPGGAQGDYCQVEALACDSSPCRNQGICQDRLSGYICTCPVGYTGVNCDTVVVVTTPPNNNLESCNQDRCQNGGICIPSLLPFDCLCTNPYSGRYCEINMEGTSSTSYLQTIYLRGNVSDNNQALIQQILQRAVDASTTSSSCCLALYIVEKSSYVDQAGNVVVGYVYNVTHTEGGTVAPGSSQVLNTEINNDLRSTAPFNTDGVQVYTGPIPELVSTQMMYYVDFIGDLSDGQRQELVQDIQRAWDAANPNCNCQFTAQIRTTEEYAGEYGIKVNRVYYTLTRDGEGLDPATTEAPSRSIFMTTLQQANSINSVYGGTFLLPYNQRHSLLLNQETDLGGEQGAAILASITAAWEQWKLFDPSVPPNLRNAEVDIIMLRPQMYYTQDGQRLTRVEYFVVLNNTIIIGPPSTVTVNSPLACTGCDATPVPFVDIRGFLSADQIRRVGASLNNRDIRITENSQQFVNSNGEPVTRIYYQPPIPFQGAPSASASQQVISQVLGSLNLQQPSLPTERTFAVTFAGTVNQNDESIIRDSLTNAWADYFGIPREQITIDIKSMDGTFTSASGNTLSQVTYTVSVQSADSHWTRFQGIDAEILRGYFTSGLVVIGGLGTFAPPGVTTASPVTGTTATATASSSYVDTIYVRGNISDGDQGRVEEILQQALNTTTAGQPCCVTLYVVERTRYVDPSGETVYGYRVNITSNNGNNLPTLTPEQRNNLSSEINTQFQSSDIFRLNGVFVYTDNPNALTPTDLPYVVNIIGDLPENRRQAIVTMIEQAWNEAYPGCGCTFVASIQRTQDFNGDYGIQVSRVSYTMRRDGEIQDPNTVAPPTRNILYSTSLRDTSTTSVYAGTSLLPSDQRHSLLLNTVVDMNGPDGDTIRNNIQLAWENFRQSTPGLPPGLRDASLEIRYTKPRTFYTQDGREVTNLEYFVVLNGTAVIGPQVANATINEPLLCTDCTGAVPVPAVDVNGQLTSDQIVELGLNLDPTDPTGDRIKSEILTTPNGGVVTRVFYRPPFTGSDVQSTAVSDVRLTQILTTMGLGQPAAPTEKVYTLNFAGAVGDNNRGIIQDTILNVWADTFNIPRDALSVTVNSIDDNYATSAGGDQASQVSYTVCVQGADSQWTRYGEVDLGVVESFFGGTGLSVIAGTVVYTGTTGQTTPSSGITTPFGVTPTPSTNATFLIQTIFLTGNISDSDQNAVRDLLQNAINSSLPGRCCYSIQVLDKVTFLDPSGKVVVGYRYNITNTTTDGTVSPMDGLETILYNSEIQTLLQSNSPFRQMGTVLYLDDVNTLTSVQLTYTVDFIGDIPDEWRRFIADNIERAWQDANPGCGCVFRGDYVFSTKYTGDLGITVNRVFYTMRRDGRPQSPDLVNPPAWNVINNRVMGDNRVNSLYSGSVLYSHQLHHDIVLNNVVDMDSTEGRNIINILQSAWRNWIDTSNAVPPNLRTGTLEIVTRRPQLYYTQDGQQRTNLEYFVVLNGTFVIPAEGTSVTLNDPVFCDSCRAIPVPYFEVRGQINTEVVSRLGELLNPTNPRGISLESFENTNGELITRVYYWPPISDPNIPSWAVSDARRTQILTTLNLQRPSLPLEKTFTVYVRGSIDTERIRNSITTTWATIFNIPRENLVVDMKLDSNYINIDSNTPVTQLTYTVSIQGADSRWTRYEGLSVTTLTNYLRPIDVIVVEGEVRYTGQSTPPPNTTPPPGFIDTTQVIFISGDINQHNRTVVEEILQNALNKSTNGSVCCLTLQIVETTSYVDGNGNSVVGYRVNVTNGSEPVTLTPSEFQNLTNEVNNEVISPPYITFGYVIYTGPVTQLRNVELTYFVDLVGKIPNSDRPKVVTAIENAWRNAYPDCRCEFNVNIASVEDFNGDYGTMVSRVYYTITRDGQSLEVANFDPPTTVTLQSALTNDKVEPVYTGVSLLPYNKRQSVVLSSVVHMDTVEGGDVQNAIRNAWIDWRNTDPSVPDDLRDASIEIIYLRPQLHYTQDGRNVTNVEYFVRLNNTIIDPSRANISLTGPAFCNCVALPVPFVEISGQLTDDQVNNIGALLNPADPNGSTLSTDEFIDQESNPVTRVYYRPPISNPDVQSTGVTQQRLTEILTLVNLQEPTEPVKKTLTVNFNGSIGDSETPEIQETIRDVWSDLYDLRPEDIDVEIINTDDNFVSSPSNNQVTQVQYAVSIQGIDSHWTRFEGADPALLEEYFITPGLSVVTGEVIFVNNGQTTPSPAGSTFYTGSVYLLGNVSNGDQDLLGEVLQNALNNATEGSPCCLTLTVIEKTTYMDPSGGVVTGVTYNISNSTGGPVTPMTPTQNTDFAAGVNNQLLTTPQFIQYGIVQYTGDLTGLRDVDFAYFIDYIGDIPSDQANVISGIENTWQTSNAGCGCTFRARILLTNEFTGDYGIKVSRVYYTITRDGVVQDPATVSSPPRNVFITVSSNDPRVNSAYSGTSLIPYGNRHSILLNGDVDMGSGRGVQVLAAIRNAWTNWKNTATGIPDSLKTTDVEIRPLRTVPYYNQAGQTLTQLEYYVVLNGTTVIPPQPTTPSISGDDFCSGCSAIFVPFVDIRGEITPAQLQTLANYVNPSDTSGQSVSSQTFADVNGEPVTRVFYRRPITNSNVQTTELNPQIITQILNRLRLQQPTVPIERTFSVNFAGSIGNNNRETIEQTLRNVWTATFNIPADMLQVEIVDMDDNYADTSNNRVTRVTYVVSIQGADSYWTRYEGVDPGTLGSYFTSPGLVIIPGEVIYTQYSSSPDPPGETTTSTPPPSGQGFSVHSIYLKGNVSDSNAGAVNNILQTAINVTQDRTGLPCCIRVYLLDKTTYVDETGDVVVGYRFNMTNPTEGTVPELTRLQNRTFVGAVNDQLQNTNPFSIEGVTTYIGSLDGYRSMAVFYYVDLIGYVSDQGKPDVTNTINDAWNIAYPDCGCQWSAAIVFTVPYVGDYGMVTTRVYYTMSRDDQLQSPSSTQAPSRDVLRAASQKDVASPPVYTGSSAFPYQAHHTVLLNNVVEVSSFQGNQVKQALEREWETWRRDNPSITLPQNALEITMLRPKTYYTQAGRVISRVEYLVHVGGSYLIPPGTTGPTLSESLFCQCDALPVPFVEVQGQLQWNKLLQLGTALNPEDTTGSSLSREMYFDINGDAVTRVMYRPPITDNSVMSTAVTPERVTEIFAKHELTVPTEPIRRSFTFDFDGALTDDNQTAIIGGIIDAWSGTYIIPTEDISVNIIEMNDNYYNPDNNNQVTRVTYTAAIQGGDSRWTRFEGMNSGDLAQSFPPAEVLPCGCAALEGREIMVTGSVGNDTSGVEIALINAWGDANPDFTGTLTVGITQIEGATPTKLLYTVTPEEGPAGYTEADLTPPTEEMLNNQLQPLDLIVYKGAKPEDEGTADWVIPVVIILVLLILIIIAIVVFLCIRNRRHRMSHTLKQKPGDVNGYDKQHFSDEPHFENPAFNMDDPELDSGKTRTYVVNEEPNMEEIKLS